MADIRKYPNPLRLFTQTRDEWFTELVESLDIPMHVFSAVRDTQLGQLMFAIETMRMKRKRAGEDPGPGLLEGENATMFIPLFKLVKQLQDYINADDFEVEAGEVYDTLLTDKVYSKLEKIHKSGQEWFIPLKQERLDELYLTSCDVFQVGIIDPLLSALNFENIDDLQSSISEKDESFSETIFNIFNPEIADQIREEQFTELEGEQEGRVFSLDDEEITLTFNEYHGRVNLLYTFILELKRFVEDQENYGYDFDFLEPLLSLETIVMYPQPDTSRLPLIKEHMSKIAQASPIPSIFFDVLVGGYQSYSRIEEANPRLVRKLFSTLEKTMKDDSRSFWKQALLKIERGDRSFEKLIAIIWSHLRAIQSQAQYKEQQSGHAGHSHSQSHAITIRLEHIFWIAGRKYVEAESYDTSFQFWSAYAAIANKQVRSKDDSLALFHELDELLTTTRILTNKKVRKSLVANDADQYSLIQRVLSYGLEARTDEIYDQIRHYLKLLEKLLDDIDVNEMHESFDLDQEKKVVDDIRTHLKNPIPVDN